MSSEKNNLSLFATSPKGLELLLVDELKALGAVTASEKLAGVAFTGDLALAYKACLWSRLANRILLNLANLPASTPEALYTAIQSINWDNHINVDGTFAVHFVSSQSAITHTMFGAQKVKDAIVDQFRDKYDRRPNVSREEPEVSVYVYLHRDMASINIDLSGDSLHRRGYRLETGSAPLKENLAAAILIRAGWPAIAKSGGALCDPMCGSGTLLIEAALMAGDIAPGLSRRYFGFLGWKQHRDDIWQLLLTKARARRLQGEKQIPDIVGYDHDSDAIKIAFENLERAEMRGKIHVEKRELAVFAPKVTVAPGLVVTNPPYGERLGDEATLAPLYTQLGDQLKANFIGWKAAVFTGNPPLGKVMGLRAAKYYALFNGSIACQLLLFDVDPKNFVDRSAGGENARRVRDAKRDIKDASSESLQIFINRLRKNIKHFGKLARRQGLTTYRIYDADLPDYAFTIDIDGSNIQVREYPAPKSIDENKVLKRRNEVLAVLPDELQVDAKNIFFGILPREK